ncbi:MAG: hypothetical protein JHD16_10120 [Solirubrobacteraceae bacterium]|nr:hypothetical protein [Solirubrobacteraceae bacterium]
MTMFMFDLELPSLTRERGEAAAHECADRNAWPLHFVAGRVERRWFGIEKAYPSVVDLPVDAGGPALAPTAERDALTLELRPEAAHRLASTIQILATHFPEGFVFRATFSGSPVRDDHALSAPDLADLIRSNGLNEFTRYTVLPNPTAT